MFYQGNSLEELSSTPVIALLVFAPNAICSRVMCILKGPDGKVDTKAYFHEPLEGCLYRYNASYYFYVITIKIGNS